MAGTTAVAPAWLCVEQPGPWGRDALLESHLDPAVARELAARSAATGVRVALIRRPGRHADQHSGQPRRVFAAYTRPGSSWLAQTTVTDARELLELDLLALAAGVRPAWAAADPFLMVCTNGRRDVCCALWGRSLVEQLPAGSVWECSHTGGHRFAPTGVVLPTGYCYGSMDLALAQRVLASPAVVLSRCRGRSTWEPAGQVAELAVRASTGERDPDALSAGGLADEKVLVRHVDGRWWRVTVKPVAGLVARPASCGAMPELPVSFEAVSVVSVPPLSVR